MQRKNLSDEVMKNNLNAFERGLRDKMEQFEMPHSDHEWVVMQSSLGAKNLSWAKVLVIGGIAVSGALSLYWVAQQQEKQSCERAENAPRFVETFHIFNLQSPSLATESNTQQNTSGIGQNSLNTSSHLDDSNLVKAEYEGSPVAPVAIKLSEGNTMSAAQSAEASNIIGLASNVRKACMGEEVLFTMTNGPKGGSYLWNFGDGHFSDESNPKHRFNKAGKYDVSLSITTEDGQINTTVMSDMINIIESPDAYFFWEFADGTPGQPIAIIREESAGADTYQWTLPDGNETTEREPGRLQLHTGSNRIVLKASNKNGCYTEVDRVIQVKENSDPNIIRGGESFMPQFLKKNKGRFVLSIYDMNGNQMYETSNRTRGWDGKVGHTRAVNSTFRWKAIIMDQATEDPQYIFGTFNIQP